VREALFSMLGDLSAARFLDLFAGSGAVGIEALSRGAAAALFVDSDPRAVRAIRENLAALDLGAAGRVMRGTLPGALGATGEAGPFAVIFADPPYRWTGWSALIGRAAKQLAGGGVLALEHSSRVELPALELWGGAGERRAYGESALTLWRRPASALVG